MVFLSSRRRSSPIAAIRSSLAFQKPFTVSDSKDSDQSEVHLMWGLHIIMRPEVSQWIGLRENLQKTRVFTIRYRGFL